MYLRFRELISDRLPYWGLPADLSARTPSACRGNLGGGVSVSESSDGCPLVVITVKYDVRLVTNPSMKQMTFALI